MKVYRVPNGKRAWFLAVLWLVWATAAWAGSHSALSPEFTVDTRSGDVSVAVEPAAARTAGARWRLDAGSWRGGGETVSNVGVGAHTVEFSNAAGWNRPGNQLLALAAGGVASLTGTYTLASADTGTLAGLVNEQDARGRALGSLSGATVEAAGGASTITDTQGRFTLSALSPGSHIVTVGKAGYYPVTRTVTIVAGGTKDEQFGLKQLAGMPLAYDPKSPRGKHLIEGMPGNLTFQTTVAWNGSPGPVRFLIAGAWRNATVTDLGGGLARATLSTPAPGTVATTSEWAIEVNNGEGQRATLTTGIYFYPTPARMQTWYQDSFLWRATGGTGLSVSRELQVTLWDMQIPSGVLKTKAKYGESVKAGFDPNTGEFVAERDASGWFDSTLDFDNVENVSGGKVSLSGSLTCGLRGLQSPLIEGTIGIGVSGKTGVGAPASVLVGAVFPAFAPPIATLRRMPVVGDIVDILRLRLFLIGELGVEGSWTPEVGTCWLGASSYEVSGTLSIEGQAVLAAWGAEVGIYAGGTGGPSIQVCPTWEFQGIKLRGYIGVFASAWLFEYSEEVDWETTLGEPGGTKAIDFRAVPGGRSGSGWRPLGDGFLKWGEAHRLVVPPAKDSAVAGGAGEQAVVENVTKLAVPTLLVDDGGELVLFALQDPSKPWYRATDIGQVSRSAGGPWQAGQVTNDNAPEFTPRVVCGSGDTAVAAWTRVAGDVSSAGGPGDVAPHLEIVASVRDRTSGTWSPPTQLTNNGGVDRAPQPVVFGANEGILWIQNEADASLGDAERGDRLLYAPKAGDGWDTPVELWSGQKGVASVSFVADATPEGHAVFVVDEDGDPETVNDRELYAVSTLNGSWQPATRLTADSLEDAFPVLVVPGGETVCVWRSGDTLRYSALAAWNPRELYNEATSANQAPTLDGATLPGGAVIAYTVQGPAGTDIMAAFYDATLDRWSQPRQLSHDEHAETALSVAQDNGDVVIAYLKTQTLRTDMDVEIDGVAYPVTNVPQPGRTDLCILRYAPGTDLGLRDGSLQVDPANPAPGSHASVRAIVENLGESPVHAVGVVLYDGDPGDGGTVIETVQITEPLVGGSSREVSFQWDVPADPNSHRLFVVCDPALALADRDRANNAASLWTVLPDLTQLTHSES